jgi:hypothetical protein
MSGQQTFVKIGVTCVAIALGAGLVGSQLSTGGKLASLVQESAEEDEAGAVESADADDADASDAENKDAAQADDDENEDGVADNDENEDGIRDDLADDEEVAEGDEDAGAKDGDQKSGKGGILSDTQDESGRADEDGEMADGEDDAASDDDDDGGDQASTDKGFSLLGGE